MSNSYTLQIHDQNKENEWEDIEDYETVGYQIPYSLKWEEVLVLIGADFDPTDSNFKYIDEDRDKVSIGSQDEYEIALQFCRKSRNALHIYAEKINSQPKKITENKKQQKNVKVPVDYMDSSQCEEDYRLLRPPDYEEEEREVVEGNSKLSDAGGSDDEEEVDGKFSSVQDAMVSSTAEEGDPVRSYEETKPMAIRLPYLDAIRKEIREMVHQQLVEVWNEIQVFKEDVNERLHAIGGHLTSPEQTETGETKSKQEECRSVTCDKRSANENDFAASFICENLLDGSKVNVNSKFQKYWLFKNEGDAQWDENTKLQLQDEICLPCSTNTEVTTIGPLQKSVSVPALCKNGTGDICVNHLAPAHPCNYQSSWRLTHNGNVFGPRVWCNVRVVDESGSSVDSLPHEKAEMTHCSFEVVTVDEEQKKDEPSDQEESRQRSLVPPDKCHVDGTSSSQLKRVENHHDDDSLLMTAFDMYNISDGARYIRTPSHDSERTAYSPIKNRKDKNQEAVINVFNRCKDEDEVIPKEADQTVQEIPKAAEVINKEEEEGESQSQDPVSETLDQEEEVAQVESAGEEQSEEDVALENFHELPLVPTPENEDLLSNEDEEEEGGMEQNQECDEPTEGQKDEVSSCSDDLHSVDYNLDDNGSMTSYDVSDFVVVPLPECFDVNQPLKANDEPEPAEVEEPVDVDDGSEHEDEEDPEDSEEEQDSQPNSRIRMPEYKSEDSLPPKSVTPRNSILDAPTVTKIEAPSLPRVTPPLIPEAPEMVQSTASLSNAIFQNFDAFKTNPSNPPQPQPSTRTKIPMNQIKTSEPAPLFVSPKPVPRSVLDLDKPYPIDWGAKTAPMFVPFEQGWRRNPIPLPFSIGNEEPWVPTVPRCTLPESEFTLNRNSSGVELTRPSAVAGTPDASFGSSFDETRVKEIAGFERPSSPILTNELADDFFPAIEPAEENYHTPPPSPPVLYNDIFVPSIEPSPLDRLYEMGFHNVELNQEIYNSCNGDMNRTVQALVLRMEADTILLG